MSLLQFVDRTFEMARSNIRVNGQNLEDLNDDEGVYLLLFFALLRAVAACIHH